MTAKNRYILTVLCLLISALMLLCTCSGEEAAEVPGQVIKDVTLEEAFTLMEDNRGSDDFSIIDLRSAGEYASGHIERAINLDCGSSDFDQQLDGLDRDEVYLLYSRTDDVSGKVMDIMAARGFIEVYNMLGGMERWEEIGLPQIN